MPVKDGRMWRGRKGMSFWRKTLREGAFLYHLVVDVMRREVGELQRLRRRGMVRIWHPDMIQDQG